MLEGVDDKGHAEGWLTMPGEKASEMTVHVRGEGP